MELQFPRERGDIFKLLHLADTQLKAPKYFIYNNMRLSD